MAFDAHKNLAITTVLTAPAPATSGTTLTVAVGEGARFPVAPFNCTVWPVSALPTPVNAEVVRVTARTGDVLTILRAQEGTTARSIIAGDLLAATITAKTITDIESVAGGAAAHHLTHEVGGADAITGALALTTLTTTGSVTLGGNVIFAAPGGGALQANTAPGADGALIQIFGGGGATSLTRGAAMNLWGKNSASGQGGEIDFWGASGGLSGGLNFGPGGTIRGKMHPSGGFSWAGTQDPGANSFVVGAAPAVGVGHVWMTGGGLLQSGLAATSGTHAQFVTASGLAGNITSSTVTTAYNTTSDARLKTTLKRHSDPDVLRRTVIHDFIWTSDGTPGRGVFAQEAALVAPFAVSVGSDEVDAEGRLTHPWGVDYSKYVPDLITGWQEHDHELADLRMKADLLMRVTGVRISNGIAITPGRPTLFQRMRTWIGDFFAGFTPIGITR